MEETTFTTCLYGVKAEDCVVINPGSVDFYRIFYTPEMLAQFEPAIKNLSLAVADRTSILSDVFAVCRSGRAPILQACIKICIYVFTKKCTNICLCLFYYL